VFSRFLAVFPASDPASSRATWTSGGLDRWDLDSCARDMVEEAAAQVEHDYCAAAEGRSAVLSAASAEPRGPAILAQTIFADDYRGATVAFGAEIRAEDVAGRADLRL
jgi:hypothetical protein